MLYYVTSFIFIPVYRFIVYPLVGKYIPSLLKMIGVGLSLCLLSTVISLAVDSIGHFYSNASHCIFDDNTATGTIPIPIYWVLVIDGCEWIWSFADNVCSMHLSLEWLRLQTE